MFSTLLESRHRGSRSLGSIMTSAGAHGALIAAAVAMTMTGRANATVAPDISRRETPVFLSPARRPEPASPSRVNHAPVAPTSALITPVRLAVDVNLAAALPSTPIDLGAIAPADETSGAGRSAIPSDGITGPDRSDIGALGAVIGERDVDRVPRMLRGAAQPRYPETLRAAGIAGRVVLQFVVDTSGRAEPESVEVLESTRAEFADAVRAALSRLRFTPGEVSGRRVRTRVQLPFEFSLSR
jgi:protein TonB